MSRSQGHRKSQSTSALSFLASSSPSPSSSSSLTSMIEHTPRSRESERSKYRQRQSHLPSVHEGGPPSTNSSASMAILPGITTEQSMRRTRSNQSQSQSQSYNAEDQQRERQKSLGEVMKREKSDEGLQSWLSDVKSLRSSSRKRLSALRNLEKYLVEGCISKDESTLKMLMSQEIHQTFLSLLTRHTSSLTQRASHTSIPPGDELANSLIPEIEVLASMLQGLCCLSQKCKDFIGETWVTEMFIDLLLLLRAQPSLTQGTKPIAYTIMELLFCVLVDSPKNARSFEKLGGLEAVVRVLKGTGVTKDVRMKCIEFLYFYLLPEQNIPQRAVSTSSSSSTESTESTLFPPSPLMTSQTLIEVPTIGPTPRESHKELIDLDMPFVPLTPRKPPQPNLGYLTPATRRSSVCTSNSSTPSLPVIPASPRVPISQSSTSRGLAAMLDEIDGPSARTPRSSRTDRNPNSTETSGIGLGLGLPKSTSGLVRSSTVQRDISKPSRSGESLKSTASTTFTDPFSLTPKSERSNSGSSGSSTVVPASRNMSRSNTQPTLTLTDQNGLPKDPSTSGVRHSSIRRVSRSPLVQSIIPESEDLKPRSPKIRHSRTQSHLSGLPTQSVPPVPPLPTPNADKVSQSRTPSKPRAFPVGLTRGIPPSVSSPSLGVTPLGASKRIPSDKRPTIRSTKDDDDKKKVKEVKSVAEKKEMLGMWLGNVEQLVQGVEKVSFWGSIGAGARQGR
ncbi:uncharacterized protein IL334_006868 [Kwoniella shivajii]|uniref:Cell division control protein 14 n=1 Tax=Kwoniella shivajii TaxID=564305 RepID=A0ABZ1D763_9TREE|nr:hypothetical protein IL334_006868 [Kwoniella shivajii]